jgi:hypothetical protein
MKYYLFKVKDCLNQEYYVLNNQFIGYIGFDSHDVRFIIEFNQPEFDHKKNEYVLIAETNYIEDGLPNDLYLHRLNCESKRFTKEEADELYKSVSQFYPSGSDAIYCIYYPSPNSSVCWLREKNWEKKKKFKEIK